MPKGAITVRFHSVGGWGAITTGKNLAMTLFDLLGYHIKANPKYGSEKKGQPTTYYLSAAPEPIRVNCEYFYVDVVLSPDPNVFHHTNALAGLNEGGVFIIQSERTAPEKVWEDIPPAFQKIIADKKIKLFALDGFKIAREEATDSDLQLRMQGIAFQGAFFKASNVMQQAGLDEPRLLDAIRSQLQHKFGSKGARVVEDNMRVVKRGFDELIPVQPGAIGAGKGGGRSFGEAPDVPAMVKLLPESKAPMSDIHRFWEQTGNFYVRGMGNDNITDPFIGLGVMPAGSALFRDMTQIRFQHPQWVPENCTACGKCYTVCPDTAIPGLVTEAGKALDTAVSRIRKHGGETKHLPRAVRTIESHWKKLLAEAKETDSVHAMLEEAIEKPSPRAIFRRKRRRSSPARSRRSARRSASSTSHFHAPTSRCTRRNKLEPADCCQSPSTPTHAKAAWSAWRFARTTRCGPLRKRPSPSSNCAKTGTSGSTCPTRPSSISASTTSKKASGRSRPSSLTSRTTYRSPPATAPAWAARKRPRCTCSWRPSKR
ncbi:MAG: 2-oxoacid:acceptor oxidoreductase family protein [Bryobacterales bacterium]